MKGGGKKRMNLYSTKNLLLAMLIVVGIAIIYVAIGSAFSTGQAVSSSKCVDSDGGLNYNIYGYVTYKTSKDYDSCSSSVRLIERYCLNGRPNYKEYVCPYGCSGGMCLAPCNPQTCSSLGKQCGSWSDGCGNTLNCGSCGVGYTCSNGQCTCVPNCDGKQCGDDGCGGSCGTCQTGQTCNNGICTSMCIPQTCSSLGKQCGNWSDGCGSILYCGNCAVGYTCDANGNCIAQCIPQTCSSLGKQCGNWNNGCGGTLNCGSCSSGYSCDSNGICQLQNSCSDSDGGFVIEVQGTASGYLSGSYYSYTDFCLNYETLTEYTCSGGRAYNYTNYCPTNVTTHCSNGACV